MRRLTLAAIAMIAIMPLLAPAQTKPDGFSGLTYYSARDRKPVAVVAKGIDIPPMLDFAKPFLDRYRISPFGFVGSTMVGGDVRAGLGIGRGFCVPKTTLSAYLGAALEVGERRPVCGGVILGLRF